MARPSGKAASRSRRSSSRTPAPPPPAPTVANEIWGIVIGAIALALVIALVSGERAPLASFVAAALKLGFGFGAYFVPVAALVWAATFFVDDLPAQKGRAGLGLRCRSSRSSRCSPCRHRTPSSSGRSCSRATAAGSAA